MELTTVLDPTNEIKVKKLYPDAILPTRGS